jgi:hypothetical protein
MRINRAICLGIVLVVAVVNNGCGSDPVWKRQSYSFALPPETSVNIPATAAICALGHVTMAPMFRDQSFTYRTAKDTYEHDPYAGFFVAPERELVEPMRALMRENGGFGHVVEPGSALAPSVVVEVAVNELYGDFRKTNDFAGVMTIHFIVYKQNADGPGPVLLDKVCDCRTPMTGRTPAALMAAWDTDLRKVMEEINSDYAKTHTPNR